MLPKQCEQLLVTVFGILIANPRQAFKTIGQTSLGPVELVTMRNLWNWSHNFWTCGIGHNFFFQAIVELVTIFGTNSTTSMRVLDLVTDKKSLWNRAQLGKKLSEFENVDCDLFQYY